MRMHPALLGLTLIALIGCAKDNPVAPAATDSGSSTNASDTFVLTSADDPRLPAPGLESASATTEDRDLLDQLRAAAPTARQEAASNPVVFWNRLTTELGRAASQPPPLLSRSYALVQVSIFDALVAARSPLRGRLPEHAVAAGAATRVLRYLFPASTDRIKAAAAEQIALDGERPAVVLAGWALGRVVGSLVVARAKRDGSDAQFTGTMPSGDGIWTGTNPVLPMCGTWKTWILPSGSAIEPPPPYAFGSPEDLKDVQEVLDVSLARTPEQIEIVHKWGDMPPPAIWNELLNDRIESQGIGLMRSARAHAYLNVAMADAFICCWATKYRYWTARPFQRTPGLVTVIPTPNFPSYTSGHSTISAAAAVVLGEVFPTMREFFAGQAEEAAMSRLWGGIHFRQDNDEGAAVGMRIGKRVVRRMHAGDPSSIEPQVAARGEGEAGRD